MAINSNSGTRLFISPTTVDPQTINRGTDAAAFTFFDAITDWIEVEEVEDFGTVGDTSASITFTAVKDARVRKLKGERDAGTQSIAVGRDPLDEGQEMLISAQKTNFNYPIKIEMKDAPTAGYTNSVLYYAGLVMSNPTNLGNVSNVVRRTFDIGINTGVYEVVAEEVTP
jgi:hypothetical protein